MSDRTREMATVRENSRILDGYYKMTLHAPVIAQRCRPGQFVFIRVGSGTAPLLRRPISICEADSIGGTLTLLYRVVGPGTDLLSAVRAGQALDVMGPHRHAVPRGGRAGDTGSRRHGGGAPVYAGPGTA